MDNGKTIQVKAGDQITIALEGNPSTGYTWEAADLDTSMFQQVGEIQFQGSNPGLVGSGGTLTLTFATLQAGTAPLTLVYHRPWETNVAPQSTFTVTVIVK
jgi:inhibitor of cysteine peptidase